MKLVDNQNRGFISTFVSELYAILIGIGITSVIFNLKIEPENWSEIVMAIFVTIAVTLYWWDWATFVDSHFVVSPYEFGIDFVNLVILEFLFVYFNDAKKLSATFFVLGIVDFIWVYNHLRQRGKRIDLKSNGWIKQKIIAIIIYGLGLLIVTSQLNKISPELLGLVVIVTHVLVRIFCFKGVKPNINLTLRTATEADTNAILEINHHYVNENFSDKFLLQKLTDKDLKDLINRNPDRLLIGSEKSKILAYAIISHNIPINLFNTLQWLDPSLSYIVQNNDVLYIDQFAVNPHLLSQGIGKEFYKKIMNSGSASVLCSFVALEPRCNITSLKLHLALGFEKAALFSRDEFLGVRDYKSLLLVHK